MIDSKMPQIAKLPLSKKVLYSLGQLGVEMPAFFLSTYIFIFYAPLQGEKIVASSLVGSAVFAGTLIQAFSNPFIGNFSDKMMFKVGRRRFFILTGFIPLTVFFALIWFPFLSGMSMAILLALYLMLFNLFFAYVVLPYQALIPEIAISSGDRVVLTTIASYFTITGIILASIIPSILLYLHFSFSTIGAIISVITAITYLIVGITIKENRIDNPVPRDYSVAKAFVQTFKNRTFDRYIIAYLFFQFGFYFFEASLGYYVEDIVMPGNASYASFIGLYTLVAVISAIIFSPVLVKFTKKYGEKRAFIVFMSFLGSVVLLAYTVGLIHIISNVVQMFIIMILAGLGLASYFILPNAIVSEIIDEDEMLTGYRREGMYFGVQGLLERIPSGLSGFVLGLWITYMYLPTHNSLFIRDLSLIGGIPIIINAILFIFVPLKQDIKIAHKMP
ncbi:MFS transporter [Thermoplasma sp.]|uniref:MFS transporter n=1 Tax=Thermoplasma sp. TaxID=1973142 RepID=UPI002634D66D|nr:MFS transporter [Thermoplasma sp.]